MKVIAWIFAAIVLSVAIGFFAYRWYDWDRFGITIEVQTPDGIRSGSSIIQTRTFESGNWGPTEARGIRSEAKGEATFVDLGHGRNLVGLLAYGPEIKQGWLFGLKPAALAPG